MHSAVLLRASCTWRYLAQGPFQYLAALTVRRSVRKILALLIEKSQLALIQTKTTPVTPVITHAAIAALTAAVRSSLVIPRRYKVAQTLYPLASSDVWPNHVVCIAGCDNELPSPLSAAIFNLTLDAFSRCFSV